MGNFLSLNLKSSPSGLTFPMAPWRVGFGAVFLAPKIRFMAAGVVLRALKLRGRIEVEW